VVEKCNYFPTSYIPGAPIGAEMIATRTVARID